MDGEDGDLIGGETTKQENQIELMISYLELISVNAKQRAYIKYLKLID